VTARNRRPVDEGELHRPVARTCGRIRVQLEDPEVQGAFERVTGPGRSQKGFIAVYTAAASDGIGWIDRSKLY
jgi:hypothetical protein